MSADGRRARHTANLLNPHGRSASTKRPSPTATVPAKTTNSRGAPGANVWIRWSGLALLDDGASTVYLSRLGDSLIRLIPSFKPAAVPAQKQKTQSPKKQQSTQVFSSSPTLRQMMNDYNRPTARLAPIKAPPQRAVASRGAGFEFDEVDFIQLSSIPGRILRPSS